jgi:aspartyl-tRNA synthetase
VLRLITTSPGIDRIVMLLCNEENLREGGAVPDEPALPKI